MANYPPQRKTMPPLFPMQSTALQNKIKVEKQSQQIVHAMLMVYLGTLDLEQAGYEDFLNLFRLAIRKSHDEKLGILERAGVDSDSKSIKTIKQKLDAYERLVSQVNDNDWLTGHTSPVSNKAMLAINMDRNSITKNPQLSELLRNFFCLLGKITAPSATSKSKAREDYLAAFGQTRFPKYFNAKTVANMLYPLRPDAFPLINDYVERELKKYIGSIQLTPQGYIEAATKMDDLLSQISPEPHFGIIDRSIAHMIKNPLDMDMTSNPQGKPTTHHPSLNQILYGPPGTGKTFHTVTRAIQILDPDCYAANICHPDREAGRQAMKERFDVLVNEGRVKMTTFHQSFSYEDFVEGIRPEPARDEEGNSIGLIYEVQDGVFKTMCRAAGSRETISTGEVINLEGRRFWKMSLGNTQNSDDDFVYPECIQNGYIVLGWGGNLDFSGDSDEQTIRKNHHDVADWWRDAQQEKHSVNMVNWFINAISVGDLIVISDGNQQFRAIAEVTGEYEYLGDKTSERDHYLQKRKVRWLKTYTPSKPVSELLNKNFSQKTLHSLDASINREKLEKLLQPPEPTNTAAPNKPYVLIIDEINRGNISRIFGELITLLEPSKREGFSDQQQTVLPYSKVPFSVPPNLFLIGTMNTADKSLAQLDIALRRRFDFEEMLPDPALLGELEIAGINIGKLLEVINKRIEVLLGRDYMIGHSYFMTLSNTSILEDLAEVFSRKIIPLLQEYFFEDWEKVRLVLNDHRKGDEYQLIRKNSDDDLYLLFGDNYEKEITGQRFYVNAGAFQSVESFAQIVPDNA